MTDKCIKLLKRMYGDPIPELPEIYHKAKQFYDGQVSDLDVIPYLWRSLYTEEEAEMVLALPGNADEVAGKTGFAPQIVENTLNGLVRAGKLVASPKGYTRLPPVMSLTSDYLFYAHEGRSTSYAREELDVIDLTKCVVKPTPPEMIGTKLMRVIPKYDSVKNVPGLMPCENILEIMTSNAAAGTLTTNRCTCKVTKSLSNKGSYPAEGDDNPNYLQEGACGKDGHCMQLGTYGEYAKTYFNSYTPTVEEAEKKLRETEALPVIYLAANVRNTSNICCCNFDYCCARELRPEFNNPSRFRPVKNDKKCVQCGACEKVCQVNAIDKNGYTINPDLCLGCGNCVVRCKPKALKMEIAHTPDWIPG